MIKEGDEVAKQGDYSKMTSKITPQVNNETWYPKCIQLNCSSDLLKQLKS